MIAGRPRRIEERLARKQLTGDYSPTDAKRIEGFFDGFVDERDARVIVPA
jgi:hypothetical protein